MFQIDSNPEHFVQRNMRHDKPSSDDTSNAAFPPNTVSRAFAAGLYDLGVRTALGIGGAAIARFVTDCPAVGIHVISTRHESGAAFIACELSIAQKEPVAVFCTTGPGFANALLGLISAAWEGSHIVAVVGGSPSHRLGRGAFQETGPEQLALQHWLPPGLTHSVSIVVEQRSLDSALSSITANTSKPEGSLSLVLLPMQAQSEPAAPCRATRSPMRYTHAPCPRDLDKVCDTLQGRRLAIWVGAGAVGAEPLIKRFVKQTGAVVACSPRGKGVFAETHPQSVGVLGFAARSDAKARFASADAEVMLVLGSRLGEFATGWDDALIPEHGVIQVDSNEKSLGCAFPAAPTLAVRATIRPFMEALLQRDLVTTPIALAPPQTKPSLLSSTNSADSTVHPEALFASVQRIVVERSQALLMADAGNAFAWATHCLQLPEPRLRIATQFGAMGYATCGVVGLALGSTKPAVALVGDGAMLMWNELTTAIATNAHAIWVVLEDQSLGMVHHGMRSVGLQPVGTALLPVDVVAFAHAQGVTARRVAAARQVDDALTWALSNPRPCVIAVQVDASVAPPFGRRNQDMLCADH